VKRSQAALKQYLLAVTQLKLQQLEREVTQCFGAICRKSDLVHQIRIDPESFEITCSISAGNGIPKERLSAGENRCLRWRCCGLWGEQAAGRFQSSLTRH